MSEETKNIIAEVELRLDITVRPMVLLQKQHIKQLLDLITNLQDQLQQKENIIKEVREYINECIKGNYFKRYDDEVYKMCDELLQILDKVEENK